MESAYKASPWDVRDPEDFLFKSPAQLDTDEFHTPIRPKLSFTPQKNMYQNPQSADDITDNFFDSLISQKESESAKNFI